VGTGSAPFRRRGPEAEPDGSASIFSELCIHVTDGPSSMRLFSRRDV